MYKYQSINEHSIQALINCELWGTVPTHFNDPYDMIFCYSKALIKKTIAEKMTDERISKYRDLFKIKSRTAIISKITEDLLSKANDTFRQQYCISCFSEVFDSEIMWGHYANCAKGFVVAYNSEELKNTAQESNSIFIDILKQANPAIADFFGICDDELTTLAPVVYSDWKLNFDKETIELLVPIFEFYDRLYESNSKEETYMAIRDFYDKILQIGTEKQPSKNYAFYSALCNKSKAWSYEKEWRVWAYNFNQLTGQTNNPYVNIGEVKPKAIYLGEKIDSYNEHILMSIAQNNLQVPVYKMKTKMLKNRCKLKPELLYGGDNT